MTQSLSQRAHDIEEWAEKHFLDSRGIVYTYIRTDTEGPLTDDFFSPDQEPLCAPICTPAEWHNYENCTMATAAYMLGLLYRYTVEKDPIALERARRSYHALKHIYDMGKQLEEGFMPKTYGARFSEETSSDQVLYAMMALDYFYQYADASEKADAKRMIVNMIGFWMKRGYRYRYFWEEDMLWPLGRFTALLLMGYKYSGDEAFKKEYDRLLEMGVNKEPLESRLLPKLKPDYQPMPYEIEHNAWLLSEIDGAISMDMTELDYLLRNDPANVWAKHWKRSAQFMWEEGKLALAPDGTQYVHVLVDMDTRKPRQPDPGFFKQIEKGEGGMDKWIGWSYVTGARSCDSTFIARSAVMANTHFHDPEMVASAKHVLSAIDCKGMRSYYDPDRHLPELRHRTDL